MTSNQDIRLTEYQWICSWIEKAESLRDITPGGSPALKTLISLQNSWDKDDGVIKGTIHQAVRVIEGDCHLDLKALLSSMIIETALGRGLYQIAQRTLNEILPERERISHHLIKMHLDIAAALEAYHRFDDAQVASTYQQMEHICRFESPREIRLWLSRAAFLVDRLEGYGVLSALTDIAAGIDPVNAQSARLNLWIHDALTVNHLGASPRASSRLLQLTGLRLLRALGWKSRLNGELLKLPRSWTHFKGVSFKSLEQWMRWMDHLAARRFAPLKEFQYPSKRRRVLDAHDHLAASVFLAQGQPLPDWIFERITLRRLAPHPLDGLYLARHYRLLDRPQEAATAFTASQIQAQQAGALKRWNYEVNLCHEILPADWLSWAGSAANAVASLPARHDEIHYQPVMRERLERIRVVLRQTPCQHRNRIAQQTGLSRSTTGRYLKMLIREGCIVKRTPTPAPRTHYFEWVKNPVSFHR